MLKLRRANAPFQHPNIDAAFAGDTYLSANEKRKLGLNTRMRYSHTFIACCDPALLDGVDPKGILHDLYVSAHHAVSRKQQLTKFGQSGVGKVRVSPCGKPVACAKVERLKRSYVIDQAPALPLAGCDARCCQCLYEPVIDELE
jgi:hypothetical protein